MNKITSILKCIFTYTTSIFINKERFDCKKVEVKNNGIVYIDDSPRISFNKHIDISIPDNAHVIENISANLYIRGNCDFITSTSGNVNVGSCNGNIKTVSGDVKIESGSISGSIKTVSGNVKIGK